MSCEPFITTINIHHIYHKRQWFQASDSVYSGQILSIPDGYHLFRTDSVHSERMQDIRGISGKSIAFHMHLYSSTVFPVLDRIRHQFTSIPHIDFHSAKYHSYEPGLPPLSTRNHVASSLQSASTPAHCKQYQLHHIQQQDVFRGNH